MPITIEEFESIFRKFCELDKTLGLEFVINSPGDIEYQMTVSKQHLSSPNVCHGGALGAMMDAVLGLTVLSVAIPENKLCSTVEYKTNFITPAYLGDIIKGTGQIDYKGQSLVVSSGILTKTDGTLIAKGMGTFNLYPGEKHDIRKWLDF